MKNHWLKKRASEQHPDVSTSELLVNSIVVSWDFNSSIKLGQEPLYVKLIEVSNLKPLSRLKGKFQEADSINRRIRPYTSFANALQKLQKGK